MKFYTFTMINYDRKVSANTAFLYKDEAQANLLAWFDQKLKEHEGYIDFVNVNGKEFHGEQLDAARRAAKSAKHILIQPFDSNRLEGVIVEYDFDNDEVRRLAISSGLQKDVYDKIKF